MATAAPSGDFPVQAAPGDTVSALAWSPNSNMLAASSWDAQVRVWEVQPSGQAVPRAAVSHDGPVLCTAWHSDGQHLFTGSCDTTVVMHNLSTQQKQQVGKHGAPVKSCAFIPELNQLVTGSWDRTVQYWDMRQQQPTLTVQLPERVYDMDVTHPLLVVAMANRKMHIYNLQQPQQPFRTLDSPLKMQTRTIASFPSKDGFAVGSVEGRCAIHHVDEASKANFAFKCHREGQTVYAVNTISFHPQRPHCFATGGSDGNYIFWNKQSKQRLAAFQPLPNSITASAFNRDGTIFAYAYGYDWSQGVRAFAQKRACGIMLHAVRPQDLEGGPVSRR